MNVANETLYLIFIATGLFFVFKGVQPFVKIVAGHVPLTGLREFLAA